MAEVVQYHKNIWILEHSKAYRLQVEKYLKLIRSTSAGKTLIHFITMRPYPLLIMPFKPTADDPVNAYAYPHPDTELDASPVGYVRKLTIDLPRLPFLSIRKIEVPTGFGTGKGSATYVDYHPATWRERARRAGGIAPGAGPGEILFHEMVHAFRMMSGQLDSSKFIVDEAMDEGDEFAAILAANVYRSERGFKRLRANHHEFSRLADGLSDSDAYYEFYKDAIDDWFVKQRGFCLQMAAVRATFNPFLSAAVAKGLMAAPAVTMRLP